MSYPPKNTFNIRDGGLQLLALAGALPLVIGGSSAGSVDTLYRANSATSVRDQLGTGDAVELACPIADQAGCLILKTSTSTAGSNSAVTAAPVGAATGTITLTGTPNARYRGRVEITLTGGPGVGRFKFSLDGGYTYSEELTIPSGGTYVIAGSGITLTFVPGAGPTIYQVADVHTWTSTAPLYTTSNLATAITALWAQLTGIKIRKVLLSGKHASAANAATMFAAFGTHLTAFESREHFARGLMDAGTDTTANVRTSFAAVADRRIGVVYGDADIASYNTMQGYGTPRVAAMNAVAERSALAAISENLGRRASGVLRGVRAISHDEGANTSFQESDKITTLCSVTGRQGFFVTNGFLKSPSGSDFQYWDYGVLIDEVCDEMNVQMREYHLAKVRALKDGSGRIDPRDADGIDANLNQALHSRIMDPYNPEGSRGHASAVQATVDRNANMLSTRNLVANTGTIPLISIDGATINVGFARSIA